ncbi:outer membrane protein assembly factor BamA [Mesosutterella sp. AGMB02718]|uniref:Outer membrane protein assembly factor BamA n=1 Tax=Mesosutterella faecium TaxID=2925194 RepID=A0ABT7IMN0_9BURK|nr:outer membrane protein assembly factor BamA [Mesosutterella sp. AGMB02718]MDL2059629.1 outer membrane protein assembly factor BamA [Mesosutterella sp. AGMB02718]
MTLKTFTIKAAAAGVIAALSLSVFAQQFKIKDIRVEGISRTEPGTVFSHLPFRVGDDYTPEKGAQAIRSLYQSGLFRDVNLTQDGDVIVVNLTERPAVATIQTNGIKAFDKDEVEKSLKGAGLAEGRIFNSATLDKATQELRRQYLAKGFYGVEVSTNVTPLERNRVRVTISVDEGSSSSIKQIRFTGLHAADEDDLRDVMQLGTPNWFSWYTKRDQYSREKLAGDLEAIRSWYLNRGYLDYRLDSVQVTIAPNKEDVYITINIDEGKPYKVASVKIEGEELGLDKELQGLLKPVKIGSTYSAETVNAVGESLKEKFSTLGYAFAKTTPNPVTDRQKGTVDVIYTIDPGRRAYVRNVIVTGNTRTRDEVVRREVRQYEASWFDSDKVKISKDRINRLGFFDDVTVEPTQVAGTRDEVDLNIHVKERPTGNITLGAGLSSSDGIILSAGISQTNIFGTGNSASVEVSNSDSTRTYALSLTQPYVTPEGVSRTIDIYDRRVDLDELDVSNVMYETLGASLSYGVPVTELDRIYLGAKIEQTKVTLRGSRDASGEPIGDSSPRRYWDYVDNFGKDPKSAALTFGWSRDSRDNALAPNKGRYQRLSGEVTLPVLDLRYYKASYQFQQYWPVAKYVTAAFNTEIGYADSYGDKEYPFFKNFYAGGIGSVRGFDSSSLGPRDSNGDNLGGQKMFNFSAELYVPLPGADRTLRAFGFFDGGWVWGKGGSNRYEGTDTSNVSLSDLRYSVGVGVAWISPLGPLKFSIAFPLNDKKGDDVQRFQFQIGTGF